MTKTKKVLIVDDEKKIRDALAEILVLLGYEVDVAANGEKALLALR